jgi:hypothetical protein
METAAFVFGISPGPLESVALNLNWIFLAVPSVGLPETADTAVIVGAVFEIVNDTLKYDIFPAPTAYFVLGTLVNNIENVRMNMAIATNKILFFLIFTSHMNTEFCILFCILVSVITYLYTFRFCFFV